MIVDLRNADRLIRRMGELCKSCVDVELLISEWSNT